MIQVGQHQWQIFVRRVLLVALMNFALFAIASAMTPMDLSLISAAMAKPQTPFAEPPSNAVAEGETDEVLRANNWTVGIIGGLREGTGMRFISDIAAVVDDGDEMRVIPITSRGMKRNILDLLYLKGVDMVLTPSDVFAELKKDGKTRNIDKRVNYVTSMYLAVTHILVRPEINTVQDLEGKKVSYQGKGTSTTTTGSIIFSRLGVKVDVTYDDWKTSLEKMKRGELFGVVLHRTKGDPDVTNIDPKLGLRLLSVPYDSFTDYYVPITFDHSTYPNLISENQKVEAIAAPVILAVYNWVPGSERHRKVSRFIKYFFERFDTLTRPPYQPEWKEINLGAKVPGWTRYSVAEEMLVKIKNANSTDKTNATSSTLGPVDQIEFKEFLEWQKRRNKQ